MLFVTLSTLPCPSDVMCLVLSLPPSQIPLSYREQRVQIAENTKQTNETQHQYNAHTLYGFK